MSEITVTGKKRQVLVVGGYSYAHEIGVALRRVDPAISTLPLPDAKSCLDHLVLCGKPYAVPDLILLDLILPGGPDGLAILAIVRQIEVLARVPVLMVSNSPPAPEHYEEAQRAGASAILIKPAEKNDFPEFARQICVWLEDSRRSCDGALTGKNLVQQSALVASAATAMPTPAQVIQAPPPDTGFLAFMQDLFRRTMDPIDVAINEACRRHHIPPSHARGRSKDQYTVANRHAVIQDLMSQGFGDRVILENFCIAQRQLERLRAEWRGKGGGLLSDRPL